MFNLFNKISTFRKEQTFYYYLLTIITLYALWKLYKQFIYNNIEALSDFGTFLNYTFGEVYVKFISAIFSILGISHTTFIEHANYGDFYAIALDNSAGIFVAYHCLGFTVFYLYIFTILLLKGALKRKLKYIAIGTIAIFLINTFRLIALTFLRKHANDTFFDFNHSVIFVALVYSTLLIFHLTFLRRDSLIKNG